MDHLHMNSSKRFKESSYGRSVNHTSSSTLNARDLSRVPLYILFIAFFIYQLQGSVYTSGGLVSQALLFLVIAIDLLYFLKTLLLREHNGFFLIWTGFLLLNVLGFIFWGGSLYINEHFSMLKGIVLCLTSFYPAYYLARKGKLRRGDLLVFFVLEFIASIVSFFYSASVQGAGYGSKEESIVNNLAYSFVLLTPYLFLIKRRELSFIALCVIVLFTIMGAKRGAIAVEVVLLLLYFYNEIKTVNHRKGAVKNMFMVLVGLGILGYVVYKLTISDEFLVARFKSTLEGNSSGRDAIYSAIWNSWWRESSNDWITFLFGFGFAGSMQLTNGLFAHNDWLEALSNFGLLGVLFYLSLIVCGFSNAVRKSWAVREDRMLLFTIMSSWLLISFFSMWYTDMGVLTQTTLLGYLMGKNFDACRITLV